MRIGFTEILVILAVALVVLGPEKLPLYMKKFGQAMRELKKYSSELTEDLKENVIAPLDEAQRPLREAMEAPETAAAAEEPAAETQKESTNNTQEEL